MNELCSVAEGTVGGRVADARDVSRVRMSAALTVDSAMAD